jgi:hypothetical protein
MLSQPLSGDLLKRERDSRNARLMPIMNRKTAKANQFLTYGWIPHNASFGFLDIAGL